MTTATLQPIRVLPAERRMPATPTEAAPEARVLWLSVSGHRDGAVEVPIVARRIDDDVDEVRCAGRTIGYIERVAPLFVALEGSRRDTAEECAQSPLWNRAAALLLETDCSHHRSAASTSDSRCALIAS